jgi:hypothetical protein
MSTAANEAALQEPAVLDATPLQKAGELIVCLQGNSLRRRSTNSHAEPHELRRRQVQGSAGTALKGLDWSAAVARWDAGRVF